MTLAQPDADMDSPSMTGRPRFRFPMAAIGRIPRSDLWIARVCWLLALPAQYEAAIKTVPEGKDPFSDCVVLLIGWLAIFAGLRLCLQATSERFFKKTPWVGNLATAIFICWSGVSVTYGLMWQFVGYSGQGARDPLQRMVCDVGMAPSLGLSSDNCKENDFLTFFVAFTAASFVVSLGLTIAANVAARMHDRFGDPSARHNPRALNVDPPLLVVSLLTGFSMAIAYSYWLRTW